MLDAIILAGGKGTRMEDTTPKPLIRVKDKPIIYHQLDYLIPRVREISISLGSGADKVKDAIEHHYGHLNKIRYAIETEPLGTAGGIRNAYLELRKDSNTVVLNCDDITDMNLLKLEAITEDVICSANKRLPFSTIEQDHAGYAIYKAYPLSIERVSCGWYKLNRELLAKLPEKGSIEHDVFDKMKIRVYHHDGFWHTLNDKKDVDNFEKLVWWPSIIL